jgi:hypothetical protein
MPLEVTDALLEFLFGEEQTIVLTIDRRAVASSADSRAQIAKQHLALAYQRFGELLAATDDLIEFLLAEEKTTALAFNSRLVASSADSQPQAAARRLALAVRRFHELPYDLIEFLLAEEKTTALAFNRRLGASSADSQPQAAARRLALAVRRFHELPLRFARRELVLPARWELKEMETQLKLCSHLLLKKDQMLQ